MGQNIIFSNNNVIVCYLNNVGIMDLFTCIKELKDVSCYLKNLKSLLSFTENLHPEWQWVYNYVRFKLAELLNSSDQAHVNARDDQYFEKVRI